jgi:molybdopterin-guanine dinucleotide biosynthesis protein
MRPFMVGIGGAHSGSGKTTVACRLLERLTGWGAIKFTPSLLYTSISDEPSLPGQEGKDTALMLEAGAGEALWVQSTEEDMPETLRMAVERLSHLDGIVVEGNSAIEVLSPDIVIFMAGEPDRFKHSAEDILRMADLAICPDIPPQGAPGGVPVFKRTDTERYLGYITGIIDERKDKGGA